jgi:drug/metabolite transporter (DMT)-like permease
MAKAAHIQLTNEASSYGFYTGMMANSVLLRKYPMQSHGASASTLFTIIYLRIVPMAVGYSIWEFALANASANRVASSMYLAPVATFTLKTPGPPHKVLALYRAMFRIERQSRI